MTDQELRAKALEIAALILGPTNKQLPDNDFKVSVKEGDKITQIEMSDIKKSAIFKPYHKLAYLVAQYIRGELPQKTE
jgi:hypothetical protein